MEELECYNHSEFKYCIVNNAFMLGDNSTEHHNALLPDKTEPEIFTIPRTVNGIPVEQIGQCALFQCFHIKKIIIEARITLINSHSFSDMKSLTFISLPYTLEYIYEWGIHFYDPFIHGEPNIEYMINPGSATIVFETNSRLKYIGNHGISYKDTINIYFCEPVYPKIHEKGVIYTNNLNVFSLYNFTFNNTQSIIIDIPYCQRCTILNKQNYFNLFHFSINSYIIIAIFK